MSEWVAVVRIQAEQDPGFELVALLKARFGEQVRTTTKAGWLYDQEHEPAPRLGRAGVVSGNVAQGRWPRRG